MDQVIGAARFGWIARSARVVLFARALRAFATGMLSVVIALYLGRRGLSLAQIGLFLGAGVMGGAGFAALLNAGVAKWGRRATLVVVTLLSAVAGAGLLFDGGVVWLLGCAFVGALAGVGGAGGAGPDQPLEQAILADHCEPLRQPALFAVYRVIATLATALGGLAAGLPAWFGVADDGLAWLVGAFALCLVGVAISYVALPESVEMERTGPRPANLLRTPSRSLIARLNGLFAFDQLGSSLTTVSLMTYWFHTRFGVELGGLATLTFATHVLAAVSMWLSVRLSSRIGLVRTMVFTHLPASLLLVALGFVQSTEIAIAIWLTRGLLSQMDIPARDALIMAIVAPSERIAMASTHLIVRNTVGTAGPALSTALWQSFSATAPIALGGLLKTGYDVALYVLYRDLDRHPPTGPGAGGANATATPSAGQG